MFRATSKTLTPFRSAFTAQEWRTLQIKFFSPKLLGFVPLFYVLRSAGRSVNNFRPIWHFEQLTTGCCELASPKPEGANPTTTGGLVFFGVCSTCCGAPFLLLFRQWHLYTASGSKVGDRLRE